MPTIVFPEFRDVNKLTKYPFVDTATLTSLDEEITLPTNLFCDASIYIPGAIAPVYIQKIAITGTGITLTVSDTTKKYIATGEITPRNNTIELFNKDEHQVGLLVASVDFTYFTGVSKGEYEFVPKATSFVPRCVIPLQDAGVTSIGTEEKKLYGDIWLVGKEGVVLEYVSEETDNPEEEDISVPKVIRINLVGDALFKRLDPTFEVPKFVQTINGSPSNEYGDFKIVVGEEDDILRIKNSPDGITIYAAGV